MLRNQKQKGFTLIELLVVVAIISLLTAIALFSLQEARLKARNAKRASDMAQMNSILDLYFLHNKGYPDSINGIPLNMTPTYLASLPTSPLPADGVCLGQVHGQACIDYDSNCAGVPANQYYYAASGTPYTVGGENFYPEYRLFFCLGQYTGSFPAGERYLTPIGIR